MMIELGRHITVLDDGVYAFLERMQREDAYEWGIIEKGTMISYKKFMDLGLEEIGRDFLDKRHYPRGKWMLYKLNDSLRWGDGKLYLSTNPRDVNSLYWIIRSEGREDYVGEIIYDEETGKLSSHS